MPATQTLQQKLDYMRNAFLGVGALALFVSTFGFFSSRTDFFSAYLVAFMLILGLSLGGTGVWMLHVLVGGPWGEAILPVLQACAKLIPLNAVLFLPIPMGLKILYPWARPGELQGNAHLSAKSWYLNESGFLIRAAIFFLIWILLAQILLRTRRQGVRQKVSALGIILFGLAISFAVFDWVMSLEPIFYSTIFGLIVVVGQMGSAFALGILTINLLPGIKGIKAENLEKLNLDLGNFLLMSVMLWAYMSFSQFLLIWSGQLPEEILFYNYRIYGGWEWIGFFLVGLHFVLPFFLLLFRTIKRHGSSLVWIAGIFVLCRWLDLFWMVQPNFSPAKIQVSWLDLSLVLALSGIWLGGFFMLLARSQTYES